MERDLLIFLLRVGLLAILYLFLFEVMIILWRDLRPPTPAAQHDRQNSPLLEVLDPAASDRMLGERLPLHSITSIGREALNGIILNDPSVSAEHALVSYRAGRWWIEDLGSTNGTFVNDVLIDQPTVLSNGDIVRLGAVRLRFQAA